MIIVGNKCDLEDNRKVTKEEGESYAKSKGVDFMEVSALKTINVKETFVKLAHNLLEKKVTQKTESEGDKCCIIFKLLFYEYKLMLFTTKLNTSLPDLNILNF